MIRALETARIVAERIGAPVATDERLREWDYGDFEGLDREVIAVPLREGKKEFALPLGGTGETLLRLAVRVYAALEDIRARYVGQTVLVVAHGGVCRTIETYFRPVTAEEFSRMTQKNCEIREGEL